MTSVEVETLTSKQLIADVTKEKVSALIKREKGVDPEVVVINPMALGAVSLVEFSLLGWMYVFKDETGKIYAVNVPFGMESQIITEG